MGGEKMRVQRAKLATTTWLFPVAARLSPGLPLHLQIYEATNTSDSLSQHAHPHAVTSFGADFANTQYPASVRCDGDQGDLFYLLSKKGVCGRGGGWT